MRIASIDNYAVSTQESSTVLVTEMEGGRDTMTKQDCIIINLKILTKVFGEVMSLIIIIKKRGTYKNQPIEIIDFWSRWKHI